MKNRVLFFLAFFLVFPCVCSLYGEECYSVEKPSEFSNLVGKVAGSDVHMSMIVDWSRVWGRYYYDSQRKKGSTAYMRFYGEVDGSHMRLTEYYSDKNKPTGTFDGTWKDGAYQGTFTRAKDGKKFDFALSVIYGNNSDFFNENDLYDDDPYFEQVAVSQGQVAVQEQQQKAEVNYKNRSYDLVFDRPNCILSVIPMDSLPKIKSLTIRGELGKDDVSIIFDKCTNLEYLDLKNTNLSTFNIKDFSKVSKLRVFKMPSKVSRLEVSLPGENMNYGDLFKDCYYLEEVELPSSLEYLRCNLFINCPKIKTITIPANVRELVSDIKSCPSLTSVDLSQCSRISENVIWRVFMLRFKQCPNIKTIKYQSGKTRDFYCNGEPEGVNYYFSPNPCTVSHYENSTLFFKGEANNDKKKPVKNCTIHCPKSMMTHFYVEFNEYNNTIIGD